MSEIRVNTIVAAEGTSAPNLPYGVQVPTGMGITGAGGVNITGVVTAANIDGTLIAGSAINSAGVSTVGILTVTKDARIGAAVTVDGAATISGALTGTTISGTTGTFSGAVNVDATTDSTSATSGALIVDGGLGVAKNVYIGAGLSVAGTLTYEDVTNVDSVGLITAKSGVNISGGQLQVGVAYSVGAAGVCTAAGFVGPLTGAVTGTASNATNFTVADESSDTTCFPVFVTAATGDLPPKSGSNLTFNSSTGALTASSFVGNIAGNVTGNLNGTVNTGTQGSITSLGTLTGLTISGDVVFDNGEDAGKDVHWDVSADAMVWNDNVYAIFGSDSDSNIVHNGSNFYITNTTGNLYLRAKSSENSLVATPDGTVEIYYDASKKFETTYDGVSITGMTTTSAGMTFNGMLKEEVNIVANKLSAGTNIDVADGMVHYYSTSETTTATPNIRFNSSYTLNNKMSIGQTVTVTIIYLPSGSGYYAQLQVDGSNVTEYWNGGAPSSANSGGIDVMTHTITKTANATFLVLSNVQNYES